MVSEHQEVGMYLESFQDAKCDGISADDTPNRSMRCLLCDRSYSCSRHQRHDRTQTHQAAKKLFDKVASVLVAAAAAGDRCTKKVVGGIAMSLQRELGTTIDLDFPQRCFGTSVRLLLTSCLCLSDENSFLPCDSL